MSANQDEAANGRNGSSGLSEVDREVLFESVDPETVESVAKLLIGTAGFVFLLGVVSLLPGIDRLVPGTPVTVGALVVALITLGIVVLLLSVAPRLAFLVRREFFDSGDLGMHVAGIVKHLVVLLAVLVAYRGLASATVPFLATVEAVWAYDLAFLLLSLVPTAFVARHLYRGLDPAAGRLTRTVTATDSAERESGTEPESDSRTASPASGEETDVDGEKR